MEGRPRAKEVSMRKGWWCAGLMVAVMASSCANPYATQTQTPMSVQEFVRQIYVEGLPYEDAARYGPEAVATLEQMLGDPAEQVYWPNIVITLGVIGDDRAVDRLLRFVNAPEERQLSDNEFRAVTSAIMALGYAVNRTGNQKALAFLKESVDPAVWTQRIRWKSPFHGSEEARNFQLSTSAVLALGLSGNASAAETLRSLQAQPATETARRFQAQASDSITEALNANQTISSVGLAAYYRNAKR
jgi:hypothetical protein